MRLIQKKGPFSQGASFRIGGTSVNDFVHIGIQVPKCQPLSAGWKDTIPYINKGPSEYPKVQDDSMDSIQDTYKKEAIVTSVLEPDVQITTSDGSFSFYINRTGILEFDCNVGTYVQVTFLKAMPAETIVDLVYDESV